MILMFEIGLQTQLEDISAKLGSGIKIALFGSVLTFLGGYFVCGVFYPDSTNGTKILLGLICAATATGISGKVFKDLKILNSVEVQTVLTASLIDEVISILCFAVLSGVMINGNFDLNQLLISTAKTTAFFLLSITLGTRLTPLLTKYSIKIHAGISMKIGILFMICTFYTWFASELGLAPVIGAFIAGLIINPESFKNFSQAKFLRDFKQIAAHTSDENARLQIIKTVNTYEIKSLDELIKPLSNIFVPIFFTYIGLIFNLDDLFSLPIVLFAVALIGISILGRVISGYSEQSRLNNLVIGLGMTPIGEAGLIFTMTGNQLGLISDEIISSIVLALVVITVLTPVLLKIAMHKHGVKRLHI
jgi:Kef-type K+ transport system membrane component KefB